MLTGTGLGRGGAGRVASGMAGRYVGRPVRYGVANGGKCETREGERWINRRITNGDGRGVDPAFAPAFARATACKIRFPGAMGLL